MKYCLTLLLFSLLYSASSGQKHRDSYPPAMTKHLLKVEWKNHECIYRTDFTFEQRLKLYPFSAASKVEIVSFENRPYSNGLLIIGGYAIPLIGDSIDRAKLDETKVLTAPEIEKLSDILYNTHYKGKIQSINGLCFNPNNAILFLDSLGKTFEYMELSFSEGGHRESSNKLEVSIGDFCRGKSEMLKSFFIECGISIGTLRGLIFDTMNGREN